MRAKSQVHQTTGLPVRQMTQGVIAVPVPRGRFVSGYTAALAFGRIMDRIGARFGFGLAFLIWQLAHMSNAFARSTTGFIAIIGWYTTR